MAGHSKKVSKKIGTAAGTLLHIGEKKIEKTKITIIDYDEENLEEKTLEFVDECFPYKDSPTKTWINIDGLDNLEVIEKIGIHFNIDYLVLEDIVNTTQRPKTEDYGDYVFTVLKMVYRNQKRRKFTIEQVSLIIGSNYVISFQEKEGDVFNLVRDRLRKDKKRIRSSGPDYLAYALIDTIVDAYFIELEHYDEKLEKIENELLRHPTPHTLQNLHHLKRDIILIRKSAWPLREVLSLLEREDSPLIKKTTHKFLRDVYDHAIQVIDTIETHRDMISSMQDIYLSSISNKMNEVMKVLTIIATIFIPLTFIAGVYGMNFDFMPELSWPWSYPLVWLAMIGIGLVMFFFFKRKKWI